MAAGLDGQTLTHYTILARIGHGGMGEVYRARDNRLGRDVAIKTISDELVSKGESFSRFKREARILASLNHPAIAAIHDFEEVDGLHFLVLELVPGEDLARRMRREIIPIDAALEIAGQIAEALEASHDRGVIHRDLKPGNVMLTPDGRIKLLDFGLGKTFDSFTTLSQSPTVRSEGPRTEGILGTGPYMSPEQARGQPLDKRTDVWSFGCLLFEMLAGEQAFGADTWSDAVVRILQSDPAWETLPSGTPPSLRRLLRRCLEKDGARRLRDMGDVRIELEEAAREIEVAASDPSRGYDAGTRRSSGRRVLAITVAVLMISSLAFLAGLSLRPGRPQQRSTPAVVTRLTVGEPAPFWPASPSDYPCVALSADGSRLVYVSIQGRHTHLFMRRLDELESRLLRGTSGARGAFFSPDGESLGYFAGPKLWKVSLRGGTPIELADAALPRGASWGTDGWIVYSPIPEKGLMRIPAAGGDPEPLTQPDRSRGERSHRWPHVLPDSSAVLFTVAKSDITTFDDARIDALSLRTGARHTVVERGMFPSYVTTGHLLYVHKGALMAAPFDPRRLETTGPATVVLTGIVTHPTAGSAQLATSLWGTLAYLPGNPKVSVRTPLWLGADGSETPVIEGGLPYNTVSPSPDGRYLAVDVDGPNAHVFVHDLQRGGSRRLTAEWSNTRPIWTPDSRKVTFASDRLGPGNIFWKGIDSRGAVEQLTHGEYKQWPGSWSSDGTKLAYVEERPDSANDIWILDVSGAAEARPFLATSYSEFQPAFSPDDRWLAYTSTESGRNEVFVQPYPADDRKWPISTAGGSSPAWSADGRRIFFLTADHIAAVDVKPGPEFSVPRRVLTIEEDIQLTLYVGRDGRFLVLRGEERPERAPVRVVVNWLDELQRLVPTR